MFNDIMAEVTDRLEFPCKYIFGKCIGDISAITPQLGELKKAVIEYKTIENPLKYSVLMPWIVTWNRLVKDVDVDGYVGTNNPKDWIEHAYNGLNTLRRVIREDRSDTDTIRLARLTEPIITTHRSSTKFATIAAFLTAASAYLRGHGANAVRKTQINVSGSKYFTQALNKVESNITSAALSHRFSNLKKRGGTRRSKYTARRWRHTRGLRTTRAKTIR